MQFSKGQMILGKYKVLFPIKDARNAETYRVLDSDGKLCFLKLFNPNTIHDEDLDQEGELRELSIARRIQHPSVPTLIESGSAEIGGEQVPFGIFEFVPGETMLDMRRRELAVEAKVVKAWMLQLVAAVAHMHEMPEVICHNQLDLSNVMLDSRQGGNGGATLIDFGHAHCSAIESGPQRHLEGHNPYFTSPESFEGEFSAASDVFSLGAIYYNLVFGTPPWSMGMTAYQASQSDMHVMLSSERIKPLAFPNLGAGHAPSENELIVLRKALHPEKEHRFADAVEMLDALKGKISMSAASVPPVSQKKANGSNMLGFDAIAGMAELKSALANEVLGPLRQPEKFKAYGLSIPNGMLLYGPPGCGKTFISERFAEEAGLEFKKVVPSDLASIYVHGSQEKIGKLFEEARQQAPCILFFDELDALLPHRDGGGVNPSAASEVNEFLAQMNDCSSAGVFIMGATNRPNLIDPAVLRTGRMDKKVYVAPPDFDARKAMFMMYLAKRPTDQTIDHDELAHLTEKRVSSDIKFLVDEASRKALFADSDITQQLLVQAIHESKPSVGVDEIDRYEAIRVSMSASGGGADSSSRPTIGFKSNSK